MFGWERGESLSPALMTKTIRDLSQRKVRTIFTVLTIALGVMSVSLFAIEPLADGTMRKEVAREHLHNIVIRVRTTDLNATMLSDLSSLDNVEGMEARQLFLTKMLSGQRKEDVLLVGVRDWNDQQVDRVLLKRGSWPERGEALTEAVNSQNGIFEGGAGETVTVLGPEGSEHVIDLSGTGRSLSHGKTLYDSEGYAVLYLRMDDLVNVSGTTGYNYLSFTLTDMGSTEVDTTVEAIRSYLIGNTEVLAFSSLPEVRQDDEWPGASFLDMFLTIMYVLTLLAIGASMVLISNTMNTVVSEQRREIAMLKAIGSTRHQVLTAYTVTALVMAGAGAVVGAILGVFVTYGLLVYFGGLMGFAPAFAVHLPTVLSSILVGAVFVVVASLPALLKAIRVQVRQGMEDRGITSDFGRGMMVRLIMSPPLLPRTVKMGLRNAAKRKGRSISAVLQITIAVGVFLGLVTFGNSLADELSRTIDNVDYDIVVEGQLEGGRPLDGELASMVSNISGVSVVEPYLLTQFELDGIPVHSMGYPDSTKIKRVDLTIERGRWFDSYEHTSSAKVAVIGEQLAGMKGLEPGDKIVLRTSSGSTELEIIGIDSDFYYMGLMVYVPLSTLQDILLWGDLCSGLFIRTETAEHEEIDRISVEVEDLLASYGCIVSSEVKYKVKSSTLEQNQGIIDVITITSGMIVLISMVGLMSNITMNILDRTKEIGVLRCIGGVSMSIRSIFTTEAVFLSIVGWAFGVPLGYLVARFVSFMLVQMLDWEIPIRFQAGTVVLSLALVTLASTVIAQFPLIRAVRMRPGDALRYE